MIDPTYIIKKARAQPTFIFRTHFKIHTVSSFRKLIKKTNYKLLHLNNNVTFWGVNIYANVLRISIRYLSQLAYPNNRFESALKFIQVRHPPQLSQRYRKQFESSPYSPNHFPTVRSCRRVAEFLR